MNKRLDTRHFIYVLFAALSGWILLAPFLAERLIVEKSLDHAEAIMVLAGSAAYQERTHLAAQLYAKHVSQKIILTNDGERAGWSQLEQRNPLYVELAKQALVAEGVPEVSVEILPPETSGTIMEARIVGKAAEERHWKSLMIVTSAHHTRRALRTFEYVVSKNRTKTVIGITSAFPERGGLATLFWWLTPGGWRDVAGEYVKSVFYYFAYELS